MMLPVITNFEEIDIFQAAAVTEYYISLIGIILLGSINIAESETEFTDLLQTKSCNYFKILILRCINGILLTFLFITLWSFFIAQFNSKISIFYFIFSGCSAAIFLGSISASLSIILKNSYIGILGGLGVWIYLVFGMDRKSNLYPLALSVYPSEFKRITGVVILFSIGILGSTLTGIYLLSSKYK